MHLWQTDRHTDRRMDRRTGGALQYLPSRAFGAAGDNIIRTRCSTLSTRHCSPQPLFSRTVWARVDTAACTAAPSDRWNIALPTIIIGFLAPASTCQNKHIAIYCKLFYSNIRSSVLYLYLIIHTTGPACIFNVNQNTKLKCKFISNIF